MQRISNLYAAHTILAKPVAVNMESQRMVRLSRRVTGVSMPRISSAKIQEPSEDPDEPKLAFGDLAELLGYRLRRAQGAMHRDWVTTVASKLDLTQKQTATLWLIGNNPGTSQVSVAAALDMDRASMMAVIDRLEERGLVIRKRSRADRRRQELYLSLDGQVWLRKVKTRVARHEQRFKSLFTPDELERLLSSLQKFQEFR
jgi:DNA-binding MarR family transcriptional regulator